MPEVTFRKIDASNYADAMKLKVHESQKNFVASNEKSLIQAAYEAPERSTPYGIYDGDTMVGFILLTSDEDDPDSYWVWRLMVGADYQAKGYGKVAMQKLIADTRTEGKYRYLRLSYVPSNESAKKLYLSVGFVEEGLVEEWGEVKAVCDLSE